MQLSPRALDYLRSHPQQAVAVCVAVLLLVALLIKALLWGASDEPAVPPEPPQDIVEVSEPVVISHAIIGTSVEGRPIEAYRFGMGEKHVLLVGGIHGGYEWNSVLLAYEMIDLFTRDVRRIPSDVTVTIIPALNPDGLALVVGTSSRFALAEGPTDRDSTAPGRFNARDVDLNRNFDCKWQPESTWRGNVVSAGSAPFSEPESQTLRDWVLTHEPEAVVFWHSQANAVYASECTEGILPQTRTVMNTYATAAGYPAIDTFDAYSVTGDAEGWLAHIGVPAITVELETATQTEYDKNRAGVEALLTTIATSF